MQGRPVKSKAVKRKAVKRTTEPPTKIYIRLLPAIDEALRSKGRYKGDLSRMIEEALMSADTDLMTIRLVEMGQVVSDRHTTPSLSDKCRRLLKRVSLTRGASMNALVNAALARSLKVTTG